MIQQTGCSESGDEACVPFRAVGAGIADPGRSRMTMDSIQEPYQFKKLNGKVYWGARIVKGADYDSFEPLNETWGRDKHHIYTYDSRIRGADHDSFEVLNPLFARDRNSVFFLSGRVQEANATTFRPLDAGCFRNAWGLMSHQGYGADDA